MPVSTSQFLADLQQFLTNPTAYQGTIVNDIATLDPLNGKNATSNLGSLERDLVVHNDGLAMVDALGLIADVTDANNPFSTQPILDLDNDIVNGNLNAFLSDIPADKQAEGQEILNEMQNGSISTTGLISDEAGLLQLIYG